MAEIYRSQTESDRILKDDALRVVKAFVLPTDTANEASEIEPQVGGLRVNATTGRFQVWNPVTELWNDYAKLSEAGGGSSAQSDWDEEDTGSPSYIQNKPTNVSAFTNDAGYLTGITSGQVTTALGFTPYNATNPSGYITASSTDTLTNKSGNISQWTNNSGYTTLASFSANAPISYNSGTGLFSMTQASSSVPGWLSAADYTKFNGINLQYAYTNGGNVLPHIITSVASGSVSIRRGTSADTDNVFKVQNGAGTDVFVVKGSGAIASGTWNGGVIGEAYGGAGSVNGLLKANGSGTVSAAVSGTDYQAPITLTTTGTSGAATFVGNTLNIPQYSGNPGTVTSVSVVSANGFAGSVADQTTTPAITLSTTITGLLKGNGTAISAAVSGTDYEPALTFSTGLTRATNTITSNLSTGVSGGQNIILGTGASEGGYITSTSHATKGKYYLSSAQTIVVDELNTRVGINTATPAYALEVNGTIGVATLQAIGAGANADLFINPKANGQVVIGGGGFAYTTAASGKGSILFNNGTTDSPNLKFAYGNAQNLALDTSPFGSFGGLNTQFLRFIVNSDEAGGAVVGGFDGSGNLAFTNNGYFGGKLGVGISPTAYITLKAGTATANTAPLKLTSGTNLTTPESGAVEFDGTNYFATSSSTRYTLAKTLTATASLDFPSTAASTSSDLTITVTGAALGDVVLLGAPNGSVTANSCYTAFVSATDTVTVRLNNYDSVSATDPASGTFRVSIVKY